MSDQLREAVVELRACADLSHSLDQLVLFVGQWLDDWKLVSECDEHLDCDGVHR